MDEFPELVYTITREDGFQWIGWARNAEDLLARFTEANALVVTEVLHTETNQYWRGKLFQEWLSEEEKEKNPDDVPLKYTIEPAHELLNIFEYGTHR